MAPAVGPDALERLNTALAGRYRLERELGHGGMATVYLAYDLRNDRQVAVKIIRPELAYAVVADRFLREIRIEARLTHPNIITLLDSGILEMESAPPRPYYVMPYVVGESLRQRLEREGSLPVEEALRIAGEVATALAYAHQEGVVHRDIKPENILLVAGRAVVADFGIARVLSTSGTRGDTSGGMALGTPYYMSPEQWAADARVDGRTDIYSLACVLYEALSGEPPFTGPTVDAIRARHSSERPRPLHTTRPGVPVHVVAALNRALAKVPADRFRSAAEFAAALENRPPTRRVRTGPLLGTVVLFALAVTALIWFLVLRPDPTLDHNRFVVLPFQERGGEAGPGPAVTGDAVARELRTALGRWEDVTVVGPLLLADVMGRRPPPQSLRDGLGIARGLRAGYLIWGEVWSSGDTTHVQAGLYDAGRRGTLARMHSIPLVGELRTQFSALADSLIVGAVARPEGAGRALAGTGSFEAFRAWAAGDSALAAWNLELAEAKLRQALELDPAYPQANLRFAELLQWRNRPAAEWRRYADAAFRGSDRLSVPDRGYAAALHQMSEGRYPESCRTYRELLARDSLDFTAWFGLGECQRRDLLVRRDPASPSGWRFRSSYHSAITAYERALRLVPSVHLAFQGAAFDRLLRILSSESRTIRGGFSDAPVAQSFLAYPGLYGDTLAFVPYPADEVNAGGPDVLPPTRHAAVARNRARLRLIAESWIRAYPENAPALALWAGALETTGELARAPQGLPTALEAVRKIRQLAPGQEEAAFAAVAEVRLLLKTRRFVTARTLADSLLASEARWPGMPQHLASLAALTGRPHLAADILGRSADQWAPLLRDMRPLAVPNLPKESARRLLAYAVFGIPRDSVRSLEGRVRREVERFASPAERGEFLEALLSQASIHAWDLLEFPLSSGYLEEAVAALRVGDSAGVYRAFAAIDALRLGQRPGDVSIDLAYQEARILLAAGDSAGALVRLARELTDLQTLDRRLLDQFAQAAALGNALALAARLAAARGEMDAARGWATAVTALWARPDAELEPVVRALRRIAGG